MFKYCAPKACKVALWSDFVENIINKKSHVAWQEQYNIIPMGQNVHSNAKLFYCSWHATWPPCKTSINMTISMKSDKAEKVKTAMCQLLRKERPQIREIASVVGLVVSCFPGVKYPSLYYRALENDKTDVLKQDGWNHDAHMQISELAKKDLSWWLVNVDHDPCSIMPPEPRVTLKCDSSLEGWGSGIDNSSTTANAYGRWSPQESVSPCAQS